MPKVYFARHGQSVANFEKIVAGSSDYPLTDEGAAQAKREAAEIKRRNIYIDRIIASPLVRAHETARIIAKELGYDANDIVTS